MTALARIQFGPLIQSWATERSTPPSVMDPLLAALALIRIAQSLGAYLSARGVPSSKARNDPLDGASRRPTLSSSPSPRISSRQPNRRASFVQHSEIALGQKILPILWHDMCLLISGRAIEPGSFKRDSARRSNPPGCLLGPLSNENAIILFQVSRHDFRFRLWSP
jgi:hypothetical protein